MEIVSLRCEHGCRGSHRCWIIRTERRASRSLFLDPFVGRLIVLGPPGFNQGNDSDGEQGKAGSSVSAATSSRPPSPPGVAGKNPKSKGPETILGSALF